MRHIHRRQSKTILFIIPLLAAAAIPAGAVECDPFPKVAWWGNLTHESVIKYVTNRHSGDWNPYIQKWETQSGRLKQALSKGSSVVIKSQGVTLKAGSLSAYILKMDKRISVNKCLSRKADSDQQAEDAKSFRDWKPLAEKGNAASQFKIASLFEKGRGVTKDPAAASEWYRKAAEQGHTKSQYTLGKMYEIGLGVPKDYASAFSWVKKVADQGFVKAQYNLGKYFRDGLGVKKDSAEGIRWWTKAAEQGYVKAQGALGYRYEQGRGVSKDYAVAIKWYRKAAEQGNAQAIYRLGLLYETGQGVSKDPAEAVRLYRIAAKQGLDTAVKALARLDGK